jgi:L-aminopeptidase/D-esterase-like protein
MPRAGPTPIRVAPARRVAGGIVSALMVGAMLSATGSEEVGGPPGGGLTAVEGLKVGHYTLAERPTGCTVVLAEAGAVAAVDVRGSAPGTRETDLLHPLNLVEAVHAVVLAGGSAFGLDAASGVVRYLEERQIGFATRAGKVPIVPAAILFDLGVGDARIRPGPECGYRAAVGATKAPVIEGDVGAGAGATVGKLTGGRPMKAGIGSAAVVLADGLAIGALVAVNAVGDIVDPATGRVVAGVRSEDGRELADVRRLIREGRLRVRAAPGEHTTLGVVATNARLTKVQAAKMAQMAHDGLARAVSPAHTMYDGDTIFALATGTHAAGAEEFATIGALAAEVLADAIVRAATQSQGLPDVPSARTLGSAPLK